MQSSLYERIVLVILAVMFLSGAVVLHAKRTRSFSDITVTRNGIKERFTLEKVEKVLKEERKINIDDATASEIYSIPGIGEVLAERIVEYRDTHGKFRHIKALLNVTGIGEKKLETITEYVRFE